MSTDTDKLRAKLSVLEASLDDLEGKLDPLLSQTLAESVVGLETVQQAKLQVVLPYLIYDLIFIYLKTRGIDPKTHPVITELDRVRQYFDKIKNAEDPAKRKMAVDKGAANRFIKHAISQVKAQRPPGDDEGPSHIRFTDEDDVRVPVKVTSKMVARAQYEQELKDIDLEGEEESDLEMIDEVEAEAVEDSDDAVPTDVKGKGKAVEVEAPPLAVDASKKRRRAMDPFAGYGDENDTQSQSNTPKRTKSRPSSADGSANNSGLSTPQPSSDVSSSEKKTKKKAKRKSQLQAS